MSFIKNYSLYSYSFFTASSYHSWTIIHRTLLKLSQSSLSFLNVFFFAVLVLHGCSGFSLIVASQATLPSSVWASHCDSISCWRAWALECVGFCSYVMWNLPGSGIKAVSPALAGRFFTMEPPGKPKAHFLQVTAVIFLCKIHLWIYEFIFESILSYKIAIPSLVSFIFSLFFSSLCWYIILLLFLLLTCLVIIDLVCWKL